MLKKIFLFFIVLATATSAFGQDFPAKSNTLVTDYANVLAGVQKDELEQKLVAFDDSTSTQIAVVIINSTGDYEIDDYGQRLGRAWGIGQKGKNNGILVLVAFKDRKVSIQTGLGAEGAVPDIITKQIIDNDITPEFKKGDYYSGLDAGTNSLIKYMKGEYKADKRVKHNDADDGGPIGFIIIIVVIILIIVFRSRGGGGGHIIDSRGGASPFWWFLAGNMLGRGSGGWGGFSGGDSGSSSGGDSGGFGGFGGGDFGGGGSSESW